MSKSIEQQAEEVIAQAWKNAPLYRDGRDHYTPAILNALKENNLLAPVFVGETWAIRWDSHNLETMRNEDEARDKAQVGGTLLCKRETGWEEA